MLPSARRSDGAVGGYHGIAKDIDHLLESGGIRLIGAVPQAVSVDHMGAQFAQVTRRSGFAGGDAAGQADAEQGNPMPLRKRQFSD